MNQEQDFDHYLCLHRRNERLISTLNEILPGHHRASPRHSPPPCPRAATSPPPTWGGRWRTELGTRGWINSIQSKWSLYLAWQKLQQLGTSLCPSCQPGWLGRLMLPQNWTLWNWRPDQSPMGILGMDDLEQSLVRDNCSYLGLYPWLKLWPH